MMATSRPACQDADPELFFPDHELQDHHDRVVSAKSVCSTCSLNVACLGGAILRRETEGIWGGYTPAERFALLRDTRRLGREVGFAVQQLDRGNPYRVRPDDLLAVVHRLSLRGWTTERLSVALGTTPKAVAKVHQRARAAVACLAAMKNAEVQLDMAA